MVQLLDPVQNQKLNKLPNQLQAALKDIVDRIEIQSNFCIYHPNYKPLELAPEAVDRFQKLSSDLQQKYLRLQLQHFLYGVYYNGSLQTALAPDSDSNNLEIHRDLANNTFLGIDLSFYERLHQNNNGVGCFDPDWQVLRHESEDCIVVTKGGLTLHINPDRHLLPDTASPNVGDRIAIRLPKNRVQNGFYMAIGNLGAYNYYALDRQRQIVRVYFNITAEGAVTVMNCLTQQLNEIPLPFSYKTLYDPSSYDRYDSAVLYFDRDDYMAVREALQIIYLENRQHFREEVPLFTKLLAPGLALAEEPDCKFREKESFGTHRCQIIVDGLLETWQQGNDSSEERMSRILKNFSRLGIELERSYLNADSIDIYTPLDL
jgi:hypothetical protein